ncbi:zinc ribbon domain-containing protein [Paenibacillus sp. sgz500958]|uniref:zinc ribbon domain-containing protein n=1 Tax=Paenibacillus sp. sgz500958 TaxID=3242475 RepID=UPI0036D3D593
MKSIKPGRGPSAMGAMGSVVIAIFGIFWTITAVNMGAPSIFMLFGILFVGVAIVQGIYHVKNAAGRNRMSVFDITDNNEEPDPLNNYFNPAKRTELGVQDEQYHEGEDINYCPYCGNKILDESYQFCSKCGKEIKK